MVEKRVAVDPHIHFGKPCLADTRIPVRAVLELVSEGYSFAEIIQDFYPDLHSDDIRACIRFAMNVIDMEDIHISSVG